MDLTRLSVDFLSARPTLFSFLDRLRETQIVPEPKDYQTWRRQMAELESAAASGRYEEIWTLPGGQTYKVSGSPHADGAVAFFFEDISAEVTLTRRFRSELGLGQSILDSLDEAICACSPTGEVLLHNAAFSELWGIAPDRALSQMSILDVIAEWRKKTLPSPVWGDFRDFVTELGERAEWFADVTHADGRALSCRFAPLTGGATLAGFSETLLAAPPPRECREATPMREPESAKSG